MNGDQSWIERILAINNHGAQPALGVKCEEHHNVPHFSRSCVCVSLTYRGPTGDIQCLVTFNY